MRHILFYISSLLLINCINPIEESDFILCEGDLYPYYYPALNYKGNFYAIKERFYQEYLPVQSTLNSGIVKIGFHVNCQGQTGNFKTETYDFNYSETEIHSKITEQLLKITKSLDQWIPAEKDNGQQVNSHKFFAFKIQDGRLIDILPK